MSDHWRGKQKSFCSKAEMGERRLDFLETLNFCEACGAGGEVEPFLPASPFLAKNSTISISLGFPFSLVLVLVRGKMLSN